MFSLPQDLSQAAAAAGEKAMATPTRQATQVSNEQSDGGGSHKTLKKKNRLISSTSFADPSVSMENYLSTRTRFHRSSVSADFAHNSLTTALENTLHQEERPFPIEYVSGSAVAIPEVANKHPEDHMKVLTRVHRDRNVILSRSTSRKNACGIPWHWSRIHAGRRKVANFSGKRSKAASVANQKLKYTDTESVSSHEEDTTEIPLISHEITDFSFNSASVDRYHCKYRDTSRVDKNTWGDCCAEVKMPLRTFSLKYQPKIFTDIVGHEIIVQALSNAIQQEKVAPLYLFHGPGGTGKTSIANIFAMACNCKSNSLLKPCWSCRGCSRSLYITELCSGSRRSGFERIRTLLQSTGFTQTIPGYKVFIIEECHSLSVEAWTELLCIVERGYSLVVFVMITEDVNMVPRAVSSRCQKFCFSKLKDVDIALKLSRIVEGEDIRIEKDSVKLITMKAEGSMREAENILDQLGLLGSRIASSMVQQLVGLVSDTKLMDLLETVLSRDAVKTVRNTRVLIASGVEPLALVSQLASLITDILAGTSSSPTSEQDKRLLRNQSQLAKNQPERLHHALKILIETEKLLRSASDHATWVVATLLQLASADTSSCNSHDIVLPKIKMPTEDISDGGGTPELMDTNWGRLNNPGHDNHKIHHLTYGIAGQLQIKPDSLEANTKSDESSTKYSGKTVELKSNITHLSDMEEVWQNILLRIQSRYLKEFLKEQAKLISLTVSRDNAIVHLMFQRPEDKLAAETSEATISNALKSALGCSVTVNISLEPTVLEVLKTSTFSTTPANSRQQRTPYILIPNQPQNRNGRDVLERSASKKQVSLTENTVRPTRSRDINQMVQGPEPPSGVPEESITQPRRSDAYSGLLKHKSRDDASPSLDPNPATRDQIMDMPSAKNATPHKHRLLSLSSFQQADASVEPYSQDLLFENGNPERRHRKGRNRKLRDGFSKEKEHLHKLQHLGASNTQSCTDVLCRGKTMVKENTWKEMRNRYVPRCAPCTDSSTLTATKAQLDPRKTLPASI